MEQLNLYKQIYSAENTINTVRFVDLFCGMGGMRLGFEDALGSMGLAPNCVFSSEIKTHARQAYLDNFDDEYIHGDITQIDEKTMPDFDFLLAGFPCQAFSSAGKRMGFEDTRGTLFFDIARILREKMPKGFLLENVEGLVTHNDGTTLKTIVEILENIGYTVSYSVLDGKDFGLAQSRRRIYISGNLYGKKIKTPLPNKKSITIKEIVESHVLPIETEFTKKLFSHFSVDEIAGKQIKDKRGGENNIHSWSFALKGEITNEQKELLDALLRQRRNKKWADVIGIEWMDGMPLTQDMIREFYDVPNLKEMLDDLVKKNYLAFEHPKAKVGGRRVYDTGLEKGYNIITGKLSFEFNKILDLNGITPTIVATDALKLGVPIDGGIRPLTVREGLRLFGFCETYMLRNMSIAKAFDLLGNTVCVPVITEVSKALVEATMIERKGDNEAGILRKTI